MNNPFALLMEESSDEDEQIVDKSEDIQQVNMPGEEDNDELEDSIKLEIIDIKKPSLSEKYNNTKILLCKTIITNNTCKYGKGCVFAHSLEEQNVNPQRKIAYDIIKNVDNIKSDILTDKNIRDALFQLTKTCHHCNEGRCTGGYNCRYGAINTEYTICRNDMMYGNCQYSKCEFLHLPHKSR